MIQYHNKTFKVTNSQLSHYCVIVPSLCPSAPSHHCAPSLCPITVSHHCAPSLCPITVSHHCVPSLCPITVSHHCVPSLCHSAKDSTVIIPTSCAHSLQQHHYANGEWVSMKVGHGLFRTNSKAMTVSVITPPSTHPMSRHGI